MNNAELVATLDPEPDLASLHDRIVLVKSSRDRRHPPTALRGSLEIRQDAREEAGAAPRIGIALEYPQMFMSRAHHRVIWLDRAALSRLLASENNGVFEFTVDDDLA